VTLLAVDIRNDHTTLGLLDDLTVTRRWRVSSDALRTSDEWAVLVRGLVGSHLPEIDGVVVSAAVPSVLHEWRETLVSEFAGTPHVVVGPGARTGLPVQVDNPREVGTDRICNAVALAAGTVPAIAVDFGLATTFDVVDAERRYVGGVIVPGVASSLEALGARGAQLRQVELVRPQTVVAKNTVAALQSGVVFGTASQVEGLVDRIIGELGAEPGSVRVVATGHWAQMVARECQCFTEQDLDLTLRGLAIVFARNRG